MNSLMKRNWFYI